MSGILVELYKHNLWANLRLLDACGSLPAEVFSATAPGTYGSAGDTLVHLLAAEGRYIELLTGHPQENSLRESDGFPGIAALRERARASGGALIDLAGRMPATEVLRGVRRGEPYEMPVVVPFIQAINHATEHRAHVMTILSAQGIALPELDGWHYWEEALQPARQAGPYPP